jgi:cobalt/nickel transport system permease protein
MNRQGLLPGLDPRLKIAVCSALALAVSLTPVRDHARFAAYAALLIVPAALSRLSPLGMLKRMLLLVPLLAFLVLSLFLFGDVPAPRKYAVVGGIALKAVLVYGCFLMLVLTTETVDIIRALESLKLPKVFTSLLFFAVRYLRVLSSEVGALRRAAESRSFGKRDRLKKINLLARVMFLQFMMALDRSQRIYAAMLSRGYDGRLGTLAGARLRRADVVFGLAFFGGLTIAAVAL